ncbi:MAG: hypothetical protein IJ814_06565 [Paludibacteraceae bacterium]|nr:hypothetical protein [Paludibacteraceae bacterium]
MKRLICFATALLLIGAAVAADRVVQSSARRTPKWIGGMEDGYFIVSAQAATLSDAQEKAMTQLREQIVSAVATRLHSATTITMHEVTDNGSIDFHKELDSRLSVQAADIPYLANISPSHAEAYYWAKIRRADKSTYYIYHIKYPLSNSKLRLLVEDYEKQQIVLNDSLQAFASTDMADYDNLDRMLLRHSRLKQFAASLREDDPRQDICSAIRRNYEQMLSRNLRIAVLDSDRQRTTVALFYGDTQLENTLKPKTKSNCLTAVETKITRNTAVFTYDFLTGCYDEDQNWLDVQYTVLGKKITTRCYIR